jgi:hypothetical protein
VVRFAVPGAEEPGEAVVANFQQTIHIHSNGRERRP